MNSNTLSHAERQQLAAEVLTLGEELFELAMQYAPAEKVEGSRAGMVVSEVELQAAREQFFVALRLLLDVGE